MTRNELALQSLCQASNGLLQESCLHGHLWALELVDCPRVTVHVGTGARPYRVMWNASGDKKVNGKWKAVDYVRTRSFGRIESLFKFLKGF